MKFQCLFSATSFGLVTMGWLNGMGEAWTPSSLSLKSSSSSSSSSSSWSTRRTTDSVTHLQSSANDNDMMNSMKQQAMDQMKNLTPQQIDQMLLEMETMNPVQKAALKAMGMDLEAMKSSMKMMKENPAMMKAAQKMMENMTPEQLMEQSRRAQEQMKNMTPQQMAAANAAMSSIPKEQLEDAIEILQTNAASSSSSSSSTTATKDGPGSSSDPNVIAAMYQVAEYMSSSSTGDVVDGVTFSGFMSLPPIQLLMGERDEDLSLAECKECWAAGSLGATTVDRNGFQRVWNEVQEYFEEDLMEEARKEAAKRARNKRGSEKKSSSSTTASSPPKVGASLDANQLETMNQAIKNMKEDDMVQMFNAMQNMDAATEARLKAMGTDPEILKKTANLLNSNPAMRKAAQDMMKNMSPQDMLKMSQQAQEQMKNMTPEQIQQAMDVSPEMQKAFEGMTTEEIQQAMKGRMGTNRL